MAKEKKGLLSERLSKTPPQQIDNNGTFIPTETIVINTPEETKTEKKKGKQSKNNKNLNSNIDLNKRISSSFSSESNNRNDQEYNQYQDNNLDFKPEVQIFDDISQDNIYNHINDVIFKPKTEKPKLNPVYMPVIPKEKPDIKKQIIVYIKKCFTVKKIMISVAAVLIFCIAAGRLPSLIYQIVPDKWVSQSKVQLSISEKAAKTMQETLSLAPDEDWDSDGIKNKEDKSPYNPDADNNGVLDGDTLSKPISKETKLQYKDVEIVVSDSNAGVTYFNNQYIFTNYKGWVKFNQKKGIPYIYQNQKWKTADYKEENGDIYILISKDCRIEFLEEKSPAVTDIQLFNHNFSYTSTKAKHSKNLGVFKIPADIFFTVFLPDKSDSTWDLGNITRTTQYHKAKQTTPTVAPAVLATYDLSTSDRYKQYSNELSELNQVYSLIDDNHTALCSIQGENGEAFGIIYGYDYLGNLYIADYKTQQPVGVINIIPTSQTISANDEFMIRDWYEFNGLGFSSKRGDRLIILNAQ